MIDAWSGAMVTLGSAEYWVAILITMLLVIAVSIIPGVSSIVVMAIIIPFIVLQIEDPIIGIVMLATLGGVNNTLDAIPAILFGLPSAATQVTFLEGHQLARQGLAAHTLGGRLRCVCGGRRRWRDSPLARDSGDQAIRPEFQLCGSGRNNDVRRCNGRGAE